jgi:hypothetical protein
MERWEHRHAETTLDMERAPCVSVDDDLDHLIDVAVRHDGPMLVVDALGNPVGLVDKAHLLKGIQGGNSP